MSITKDFYTVFVLTNEGKPVKKMEECVFALNHGEEYKIKILNHHKTLRANASISVDGKNIGYFRVERDASIMAERPSSQERRLTFYKRGTKEAQKGGLSDNNPEQGILRVTIEQEEASGLFSFSKGDLQCDSADCMAAGGTALGRSSSQRFSSASSMKTKDKVIVIRALMVVDPEHDIVPL